MTELGGIEGISFSGSKQSLHLPLDFGKPLSNSLHLHLALSVLELS